MAKMTLKLPKAAVSMQEGKIVEWFVANGADVAVGQKLYALETEKTTMEVDSPSPAPSRCSDKWEQLTKSATPSRRSIRRV